MLDSIGIEFTFAIIIKHFCMPYLIQLSLWEQADIIRIPFMGEGPHSGRDWPNGT